MKRFITYLYKYKDGKRTKNTGYLRVDVRNQMMQIQINIRDNEFTEEVGTCYLVRNEDKITHQYMGELYLKGGTCKGELQASAKDIVGVQIQFEGNIDMLACWREEDEANLVRTMMQPEVLADDMPEEMLENQERVDGDEVTNEVLVEDDATHSNIVATELELDVYRKINLNDIYTLPSQYWHYSNNSFLLHGFWNYGYLVCKEMVEENQKKISLGVPGIYEEPEMVMASYFGFPRFEVLSEETMKQKENQQPQTGVFGCWFTIL